MRQLHGPFEPFSRHVVGRQFVQRDDDVRAEPLLRLDRGFRRQLDDGPVPVRLEDHALFGNGDEAAVLRRGLGLLPPGALLLELGPVVVRVGLRQGKDLEAAAVRNNRPVPPHELVQAARALDDVAAGVHQ